MNVMRVVVLLSIIYLVSCQWSDYTGKHQRWRIINLAQELVADTKIKYKQTVNVRKEHGRFQSYEVGFIIGQIREKYKLMMELYRIAYNRFHQVFTHSTPKIIDYITVYYFRKQEMIHLLATEIDKLIEVIESMNMNIAPFPGVLEDQLRTRQDVSEAEEARHKELEEAVKRRCREEYLMKKLNSTGNATTRKQFQNKWPVPGTWSMETY